VGAEAPCVPLPTMEQMRAIKVIIYNIYTNYVVIKLAVHWKVFFFLIVQSFYIDRTTTKLIAAREEFSR